MQKQDEITETIKIEKARVLRRYPINVVAKRTMT